jgi:NADPH:quinone reductase-like Zn-dependent oxidoreductase
MLPDLIVWNSAGYTPITTCSPRNFDSVRSLGAIAFDYNDPVCVEKIKAYTENKLKYAWDTIATTDTAKLCADVLVSGGSYGAILKISSPRSDINSTRSLGYTAMGEPVEKPTVSIPAQPEHFEFMKRWVLEVERLLKDDKLKVHKVRLDKYLENIFEGMELMRQGKVSGEKLVYTL